MTEHPSHLAPIDVACARCGAEPAWACQSQGRRDIRTYHKARRVLSAAARPCSECRAPATQSCREPNGYIRQTLHSVRWQRQPAAA